MPKTAVTTPNSSVANEKNITLTTSTITLLGNVTTTPTSNLTTVSPHDSHFSNATNASIAVIIILLLVVVIIVGLFFFLKKIGKLPNCCQRSLRKRRSSTSSSRRALDEESCDTDSIHRPNEKLKQTTEEMFTIDDFEDDNGERERDEYYYDEVFGQSEFEDESTKQSVGQLYSEHSDGHDDEMLDFDFETLGIKIDDYSKEAARKGKV